VKNLSKNELNEEDGYLTDEDDLVDSEPEVTPEKEELKEEELVKNILEKFPGISLKPQLSIIKLDSKVIFKELEKKKSVK